MVGLTEVGKKCQPAFRRAAQARGPGPGHRMDPRVVLYDEPTTGLDPFVPTSSTGLILKLKKEIKVTSVVVTHDMHTVMKVATAS